MNIGKEVTILSWNVNGIRALIKKEALLWVDEMHPDILCLQEIKAEKAEIPKSFNKEYKSSTINSSSIKGMSGTIIYSNYNFNEKSFCQNVDYKGEGRIIEQHYNQIVLFNVYFPNGKASKSRLTYKINFYKTFLKHCTNLKKIGKSIIICGDFNTAHKDIDLKQTKIYSKSGFSDKEREFFNKFIKNGFLDTYRYIHGNKEESYTWWSYRSKARERNEGWRIDYILISEDLKGNLKDAFILDRIKGSDHCPIGIKLEL
ncbi:exodeoxyribonuclease III [Aliarcobacter butzleri]|uniref:exodeoxyribonuclease III n=1 Tax=Aliarcobacter butzleri TaxID=28197 RepID=UPI003AF8E025